MNTLIDGLNINYEQTGTGPDVLLLHGWGSSLEVYRSVVSVMSSTHRLTCLDFPGCGKSDTMKSPWTIDDYTDFVLKFIKQTELNNPILVGHSHGGRVIMKLAGTGLISPPKIILLDSAGLIPKKSFKQKMRGKSFKAIKTVLTAPVINKFSGNLLEKARKNYGSADYNAAPPVLRQTLVSLVNTDLRDILPNIKCPTLLIWGENDTATPLSDAKIIEGLIPDAGLCVIKNAGHFAFCENPYHANAIIKSFLG